MFADTRMVINTAQNVAKGRMVIAIPHSALSIPHF
jgi:hypothetical protein